ncbi:MAG: hypothetical protein JST04_00420 [Bdellovibrionales bacterium]|nr:hypothetical protein [Bdellovibrionales bacterium]
MGRGETVQSKIDFLIERRESAIPPSYLESLAFPGRAFARRSLRAFALISIRGGVHFIRFWIVANAFPGLELSDLATWLLGLGLIEAAVAGALEPLREAMRNHRGSPGSGILTESRRWNRRIAILNFVLGAYWFHRHGWALLTSDRVFSIFDAVRIISLFRLACGLALLPETALVQGRTRSHVGGKTLYGVEALSIAGLPPLILLFGPWGVAAHFLWEAAVREGARAWILLRTERDLGWPHAWFRWPRKGRSEPTALSFPPWLGGAMRIAFRAEAWLLPFLWKHGDARVLVFFLPWIRGLTDLPKVFEFDLLRNRFRIDSRVAGETLRRLFPAMTAAICLTVVLLELAARFILGESLGRSEWIAIAACGSIGILNGYLVSRVWRRVRSRAAAASSAARRVYEIPFLSGPDASEGRNALVSHPERFGARRSVRFGRRSALVEIEGDPEAGLSRLRGRLPGLTFAAIHRDPRALDREYAELVRDWTGAWSRLRSVATDSREAGAALLAWPGFVAGLYERGENAERTPDRRFLFFWNPANPHAFEFLLVPRERLPDAAYVKASARAIARAEAALKFSNPES